MAGIASDTNPFNLLDLAIGHLVIQTDLMGWRDVIGLRCGGGIEKARIMKTLAMFHLIFGL